MPVLEGFWRYFDESDNLKYIVDYRKVMVKEKKRLKAL